MTTLRLPSKGTRPYRFLMQLMVKPGTFWQVCERAEIDLGNNSEEPMRTSVALLERQGFIRAEKITYHITDKARTALSGAIGLPASYVGEVAGPKYIGKPRVSGVQHVVLP